MKKILNLIRGIPESNDPRELNDSGLKLIQQNKLEKAVKYFDKATMLDPNYKEAWYNKGLVLFALKHYTRARSSHEKAIEIDPQYQDPLTALAEFDRAVIHKKFFEWYYLSWADGWGAVRSRKGVIEILEESYDLLIDAVNTDPTLALAWYVLAGFYDAKDRIKQAIEAYDNVIKHYDAFMHIWEQYAPKSKSKLPKEAQIFTPDKTVKRMVLVSSNNLGKLYLKQKNIIKAEDAVNNALELDPDNDSAWITLGRVRKEKRDFRGALEAFKKAQSLISPGEDPPYYFEGVDGWIRECQEALQ